MPAKLKITATIFNKNLIIFLLLILIFPITNLHIEELWLGISLYNGQWIVNTINQAWDIILIFSALLISITYLSYIGFKQAGGQFIKLIPEFGLVIQFTLLGQLFLISSSDIISFYLSIELQSFGVYLIASLYKESLSSIYAGLKYFILGGIASALILLGIAICYSFVATTNLEYLLSLIVTNSNITIDNLFISSININTIPFIAKIDYIKDNPDMGIILGIIFISFGILFKVGSAPMHQWSPAKRFGKSFFSGKIIKFREHPWTSGTKLSRKRLQADELITHVR